MIRDIISNGNHSTGRVARSPKTELVHAVVADEYVVKVVKDKSFENFCNYWKE